MCVNTIMDLQQKSRTEVGDVGFTFCYEFKQTKKVHILSMQVNSLKLRRITSPSVVSITVSLKSIPSNSSTKYTRKYTLFKIILPLEVIMRIVMVTLRKRV